ncbi:hypothetical protein M408DRAFT_169750 [Serendipita vermifera MAFF 305830]|uniref:F-box domain-containing protein n=1 Tax=Serendipita vermifera MAFF 305830 TaxID=933852 RepID=A0A0C3B7G6_SERVB|nr:hypothetical protein M408DRAFT_169750 [Serendipita vermifera MAFF 305830]
MAFIGVGVSQRSRRILRRNHIKRGLGWDPFDILPHEIALDCLREALPLQKSDYPARLIDFTSVSQRWQRVLLSAPFLWSEIHIKYSSPDLLATASVFLHLSVRSPLKIVIWNEIGDKWEAFRNLLLPHAHRIHTLTLGDDPPIYSESKFTSAAYMSLASSIFISLGPLPSLSVLDFGRKLEIEPSQLKEFDFPLSTRITSPVLVSMRESKYGNLFLTHVVSTQQSNEGFNPLIISDFVRLRESNPGVEVDCIISTLNANISSLIQILHSLNRPSNEMITVADSPCTAFIGGPPGRKCLLCKADRDSLVRTLGCLRSHFGLRPFKCPGCRSCNEAKGYVISIRQAISVSL